VVTVSYAVVIPPPPYPVVVVNQLSGFRWKEECQVSDIHAVGRVTGKVVSRWRAKR